MARARHRCLALAQLAREWVSPGSLAAASLASAGVSSSSSSSNNTRHLLVAPLRRKPARRSPRQTCGRELLRSASRWAVGASEAALAALQAPLEVASPASPPAALRAPLAAASQASRRRRPPQASARRRSRPIVPLQASPAPARRKVVRHRASRRRRLVAASAGCLQAEALGNPHSLVVLRKAAPALAGAALAAPLLLVGALGRLALAKAGFRAFPARRLRRCAGRHRPFQPFVGLEVMIER